MKAWYQTIYSKPRTRIKPIAAQNSLTLAIHTKWHPRIWRIIDSMLFQYVRLDCQNHNWTIQVITVKGTEQRVQPLDVRTSRKKM